jgi:hypothetical protein
VVLCVGLHGGWRRELWRSAGGEFSWRAERRLHRERPGAELSCQEDQPCHVLLFPLLDYAYLHSFVFVLSSSSFFYRSTFLCASSFLRLRRPTQTTVRYSSRWRSTATTPPTQAPGPALTNATFHVASITFAVSGERERRTFNTTRPEGILLKPGHYWLVAMLPGSMGWMCNSPAAQDPALPLAVLRGLAVSAAPGS